MLRYFAISGLIFEKSSRFYISVFLFFRDQEKELRMSDECLTFYSRKVIKFCPYSCIVFFSEKS